MLICPSILEYSAQDYFNQIKKLSSYYKYFQIDFADGIYVDNKTADFDDFVSLLKDENLETLEGVTLDFHLMVKDYEKYLNNVEKIKKIIDIKNAFIHYDLHPEYSTLNTKYSFPIGLVVNPEDQVEKISQQYNLEKVPVIQIMSIHPGAQGKSFIPETLNKIEQLRVYGYRNEIFLDGAVNDKTIPFINSLKFRPDIICPGSFLTKSLDLEKSTTYLKNNIK